MKVYTKDGIVFARAESLQDIESLLAFDKKSKVTTKSTPLVPKGRTKKSYKKQYVKTCQDCGRKCKGNIGLANHKCIKKDEFAGPYEAHQKPQRIPVTAA